MTTFGISAECGRLIVFSDPSKDLPELSSQGLLKGALFLGGGSNLLFTRSNKDLTIVHPAASDISIFGIEPDGSVLFKVDAGAVLDDLCAITAKEGYWGMENLSGIPGQIGGATVQNVGAYGTEFKDVVQSVNCYDIATGQFLTLTGEQCHYGYRDSIFKHHENIGKWIVCSVIVRLSRSYSPNLTYKGLREAVDVESRLSPQLIRNTVLRIREGKLPDPKKVGSAGSFFKNPVVDERQLAIIQERWSMNPLSSKFPLSYHQLSDGSAKLSAAWLIDKAGCKELKSGGASLWPSQPLVIVNTDGSAKGEDVKELEEKIINKVFDTFGVKLTPEVVHI